MTRHITKFFYGALAAVLLLVLIALLPFVPTKAAAQLSERVPVSQGEITLTFAPLVRDSSPAVVNIYTKTVVSNPARSAREAFFRQFYGIPEERVSSSLGSGVIVGEDGVVVTNNHVIDGATELTVVLADRRQYTAELVLADERTDLAVLRIDTGGEALPTLDFADTRDLAVGDLVLAIGNPFGVGQTVTSGIISATARTDVGISDYAFFLQTDAAVNPGNSGGALINTKGELVGVNTAIFSRSGGSNGIGFAIPAEMVRRVVDAAINEGMIVRPWLGLKGESVTFDMAQTQGLDRPVGVIVTEVYEGGPADLAGLRRGDLIVSIDGREVFDERGLKFLAALRSPGERADLEVFRGGDKRAVSATLKPPPGATEAERVLLEGVHPFSGAEVAELSPRLAEELGRDPFDEGILVTRILRNAYARRVVRPGDVILSVNGESVSDLAELEEQLAQPRAQWAIEVERNGRRVRGTVRL
ncbi:MAG: Do family serine endopeptidase [Pseudomonadota bacterium]